MELVLRKKKYEQYNSSNGWGNYESFFKFLENLLIACREHPDAEIEVDR
jgi:hypothetical protein